MILTNLGTVLSLLIAAAVSVTLIFSVSVRIIRRHSVLQEAEKFKSALTSFLSGRLNDESESVSMILIIFFLPTEIFLSVPLMISGFYSGSITCGIFVYLLINSLQALSLYHAFCSGILKFNSPLWINYIPEKLRFKLEKKRN